MEGAKSVLEILKQPTLEIEAIYALPNWIATHSSIILPYRTVVQAVTEKELQRISNLKTPNQVFCICKIPAYSIDHQVVNNSLTLYLDDIQDPGNMGSILRIADWFGISYVWCSPSSVEVYNPKVIQASMGAFLRITTVSIPFVDLKNDFPDLPIFASVLGGQHVLTQNFPAKGILVIGNEGNGIQPAIIELADYQVTIPKGKEGGAESLNAAVATGILCSALCKM